MKHYARIVDSRAVELLSTDLSIIDLFTPDLFWVEANSSVKVGQEYKDGVFSDPIVEEPTLSKEQAEQLRLIAYADPINGSDRYFAEVLAMQAEGLAASSSEVKDIKARGVAKKAEIKALYPYPEDSE